MGGGGYGQQQQQMQPPPTFDRTGTPTHIFNPAAAVADPVAPPPSLGGGPASSGESGFVEGKFADPEELLDNERPNKAKLEIRNFELFSGGAPLPPPPADKN